MALTVTEAEIEAARTRIVRQHVSYLLPVTGFFEVERTERSKPRDKKF